MLNPQESMVTHEAAPDAKIALFRSLFRGREDVYPRWFESAVTGRRGYAPACGNEWVRGVCEKPRIKCTDCPNRRFLPVTDDVIRWHLSGRDAQAKEFAMGVYPMLLDETCYFLAADFDREGWHEDVAALLVTCQRHDVPAALERSRSGNGGHLWLFFEEALPASLARRLGSLLLTETMERRPEIGLRSYDRFFPNQDTLPRGGFGNLIALPLRKKARDHGNTVFLDEHFAPHPDQWRFLASLRKIDRAHAEALVREAEQKSRVIGVRMAPAEEGDALPLFDLAPPRTGSRLPSRRRREPAMDDSLPQMLELRLANQIYLAKKLLPPALRNRLLRLAAFQNPEFLSAQAMRLPTFDKPRIIACAEEYPNHLALPRGCLDELLALLASLELEPVVHDERFAGNSVNASFCGTLRPEQQHAAEAMLRHDTGVLSATTAFGKTVVASWLIAQRSVNTLVLVHRQQLLEQWIESLSTFLGWPAKSIGRLGGGRKRLTGNLDVALMQSLVHKGIVDDRVANYGHLVVDECHHVSARSFELVARHAKAKFVTGLSATVTRKDGHHPIIFMQCGPVRHRVDAKLQAAARPFAHHVHVRPTSFRPTAAPDENPRTEFHRLCEALCCDEARNAMIVADVLEVVRQGRWPLLLTERTEHLRRLAERLSAETPHVITLRGGMTRRELDAARVRLAEGSSASVRVLLATGRYAGEGFDDPRLDTLFLTMPVSWRGTVAQYAGRLHRLHQDKREVRVYDYVDLDVPMLGRMFNRRCRGYEALGYTILLPASAVPGWPTEVALPVDPRWKRDYAASVQRLIRDGVDAPLATLFTHVARSPLPGAEGIDRARSASEAFLYRRLETLPETAGRFLLNAELPIPFDGRGLMEVDVLCADARLAIEIDGPQHLDVAAYRRDRRKDALLQRHGYLVLRFLAEDAGKRLDDVLDTVIASLVHRRGAA